MPEVIFSFFIIQKIYSNSFLQSEDISYLKEEIIRGEKDLQRVAALRDECMGRTWSSENIQARYKSPQINGLSASLQHRKSLSALDVIHQPNSCKQKINFFIIKIFTKYL